MRFYVHLPTIYLATKFVKLDRLLLSNVLVCNHFLELNLLKFI